MSNEQWEFQLEGDELLHLPGWQKFRVWVDTYGGNKIMQYCFRFTAPYAARYRKFHRQVSFSLIWEKVRDHVAAIRQEAEGKGIELRKVKGYAMSNDFRSYAMRHILKRRPEWDGMFRLGKQGSNRESEAA